MAPFSRITQRFKMIRDFRFLELNGHRVPLSNNRSAFSIIPGRLRLILQHPDVLRTPGDYNYIRIEVRSTKQRKIILEVMFVVTVKILMVVKMPMCTVPSK